MLPGTRYQCLASSPLPSGSYSSDVARTAIGPAKRVHKIRAFTSSHSPAPPPRVAHEDEEDDDADALCPSLPLLWAASSCAAHEDEEDDDADALCPLLTLL